MGSFVGRLEGLKPLRHVLAPHASERIANLAQGDVVLDTLNTERHQILAAVAARANMPSNRSTDSGSRPPCKAVNPSRARETDCARAACSGRTKATTRAKISMASKVTGALERRYSLMERIFRLASSCVGSQRRDCSVPKHIPSRRLRILFYSLSKSTIPSTRTVSDCSVRRGFPSKSIQWPERRDLVSR